MMNRKIMIVLASASLLAIPTAIANAQVPMSNRCFTPNFWCWLPGFAPLGTPCYCGTQFGPVQGFVR